MHPKNKAEKMRTYNATPERKQRERERHIERKAAHKRAIEIKRRLVGGRA